MNIDALAHPADRDHEQADAVHVPAVRRPRWAVLPARHPVLLAGEQLLDLRSAVGGAPDAGQAEGRRDAGGRRGQGCHQVQHATAGPGPSGQRTTDQPPPVVAPARSDGNPGDRTATVRRPRVSRGPPAGAERPSRRTARRQRSSSRRAGRRATKPQETRPASGRGARPAQKQQHRSKEGHHEPDLCPGRRRPSGMTRDVSSRPRPNSREAAHGDDKHDLLVAEGDAAGDYLERLLDILDYDGDIDLDVEGERAVVSIIGEGDLAKLVGDRGEVLDALQELTRLAATAETGQRSRLMLDIAGYRAARGPNWPSSAPNTARSVLADGEPVRLSPMNPFISLSKRVMDMPQDLLLQKVCMRANCSGV